MDPQGLGGDEESIDGFMRQRLNENLDGGQIV